MAENSRPECPACQGTGWVIERRGDREVATRCSCRLARQSTARLLAARIPARFANCTLDSFELWDPQNPSLGQALRRTREFVETYPEADRGLLYTGIAGIGKTHLAVAALRELVADKGVRGLYVNFLELVQDLQMSIDGGRSREEILSPVIAAEVLVLDELGAGKLSQWVMDLLYYVVNTRYMNKSLTLVTTNFTDHPKKHGEESLAQRITAPLRSRLYEMCELVDMRVNEQKDYRQHVIAAQDKRR